MVLLLLSLLIAYAQAQCSGPPAWAATLDSSVTPQGSQIGATDCSTVLAQSMQTPVPEGTTCNLYCAAGYVKSSGDFTVACNNQVWVNPNLVCVPVDTTQAAAGTDPTKPATTPVPSRQNITQSNVGDMCTQLDQPNLPMTLYVCKLPMVCVANSGASPNGPSYVCANPPSTQPPVTDPVVTQPVTSQIITQMNAGDLCTSDTSNTPAIIYRCKDPMICMLNSGSGLSGGSTYVCGFQTTQGPVIDPTKPATTQAAGTSPAPTIQVITQTNLGDMCTHDTSPPPTTFYKCKDPMICIANPGASVGGSPYICAIATTQVPVTDPTKPATTLPAPTIQVITQTNLGDMCTHDTNPPPTTFYKCKDPMICIANPGASIGGSPYICAMATTQAPVTDPTKPATTLPAVVTDPTKPATTQGPVATQIITQSNVGDMCTHIESNTVPPTTIYRCKEPLICVASASNIGASNYVCAQATTPRPVETSKAPSQTTPRPVSVVTSAGSSCSNPAALSVTARCSADAGLICIRNTATTDGWWCQPANNPTQPPTNAPSVPVSTVTVQKNAGDKCTGNLDGLTVKPANIYICASPMTCPNLICVAPQVTLPPPTSVGGGEPCLGTTNKICTSDYLCVPTDPTLDPVVVGGTCRSKVTPSPCIDGTQPITTNTGDVRCNPCKYGTYSKGGVPCRFPDSGYYTPIPDNLNTAQPLTVGPTAQVVCPATYVPDRGCFPNPRCADCNLDANTCKYVDSTMPDISIIPVLKCAPKVCDPGCSTTQACVNGACKDYQVLPTAAASTVTTYTPTLTSASVDPSAVSSVASTLDPNGGTTADLTVLTTTAAVPTASVSGTLVVPDSTSLLADQAVVNPDSTTIASGSSTVSLNNVNVVGSSDRPTVATFNAQPSTSGTPTVNLGTVNMGGNAVALVGAGNFNIQQTNGGAGSQIQVSGATGSGVWSVPVVVMPKDSNPATLSITGSLTVNAPISGGAGSSVTVNAGGIFATSDKVDVDVIINGIANFANTQISRSLTNTGTMNINTDPKTPPHFDNFTHCSATGVIFYHVGDVDCTDLGGTNGQIWTSTVKGDFSCKIVLTGKNGCELPLVVTVVASSPHQRRLLSDPGCSTGAVVSDSGGIYTICNHKSSASTLPLSLTFIAAILLFNILLQ